jgi:hypothetical protein
MLGRTQAGVENPMNHGALNNGSSQYSACPRLLNRLAGRLRGRVCLENGREVDCLGNPCAVPKDIGLKCHGAILSACQVSEKGHEQVGPSATARACPNRPVGPWGGRI